MVRIILPKLALATIPPPIYNRHDVHSTRQKPAKPGVSMSSFSKTARNRVKRLSKRAAYDRAVIYPIVDEALICHVGFVQDGQPLVIPMIHARDGEPLYLHGAKASR